MQLSVLAYNLGNFRHGLIGEVAALAVDTGGATGVSCLNARQCVGGRVRQGDGDIYDPQVRISAEPGGGQCV